MFSLFDEEKSRYLDCILKYIRNDENSSVFLDKSKKLLIVILALK